MREVQYRVSDDEYRDLCRGTGSDGRWDTCERYDPDTGKWNDDDVAWDVMEGQIPSYRVTAREARQIIQGEEPVQAPKSKALKPQKKSGRQVPPLAYAIIAAVAVVIVIAVVAINNLGGVSITIPASLVDADTTQAEYDEQAKETDGVKSITLNDDGSVTYVVTKRHHRQMLQDLADDYTEQNNAMVGSEDYPNITSVTANDDFTKFTVTTKSESLSLTESLTTLLFYVEGGMYGAISGVTPDNIHIDYVNADTGAIITSADSSNLDTSEDEETAGGAASIDASTEAEDLQSLEIEEAGIYANPRTTGSDTVFVEYAGKITNPNTSVAIRSPKFTVSFENDDGTVLATDYNTGAYIMPGDTVILGSQVSVPTANLSSDTHVYYTINAGDVISANSLNIPSSSDFEIANVSEQRTEWDTVVTGKITNNSDVDCSMVRLDALFKSDGDIIGMASAYLYDLYAGDTMAFEIDGHGDLPEYDAVEVYAQYWGW